MYLLSGNLAEIDTIMSSKIILSRGSISVFDNQYIIDYSCHSERSKKGCFLNEKIETIIEILKKENLRITQGRIAVAKYLIKNDDSFFSPEEIFLKIQKSKRYDCDQVSVYRTLSKFEALGIVKKSSFKGEATRYKFNNDQIKKGHNHEHFFKCIDCSVIEPFEDCLVGKKEKELESKGYRNLTHHLEIIGVCPACSLS